MVGFDYNGKGYSAKNCYFVKNLYADNKNLRLDIYGDCGLGGAEPVIMVTLNVGTIFLPDIVALNCYLEEDDTLLKEMMRIGLVVEVIGKVQTGRVTVPVCIINHDVIKQYS